MVNYVQILFKFKIWLKNNYNADHIPFMEAEAFLEYLRGLGLRRCDIHLYFLCISLQRANIN